MKKVDKKYDFKAPQFIGFFRGLFAFMTAIFALFQRLKLFQGTFTLWLVFSIWTTLYSWFIDIKYDWSILDLKQKYFLRKKLLFPDARYVYYSLIFFDLILRSAWILTISSFVIVPKGFTNQIFVMVVSYIEIIRRGIWNIVRIEN